jgi:protein TonB
MTSMAVSRSFECAPHATRSFAMALTLGLNLAVVLFALLPSTPYTLHAPPPQPLFAVLQPPAPIPPPAVPTLQVAKQVATPSIHVTTAHAAPIVIPALQALAPISPVTIAISTGTNTPPIAGDSNATIAYETATPPAYPTQALRAGVQGTVLLKVLVGPAGRPLQVMIERSSGSHVLDDAARRHVLAAWRFHPAIRDGHAVEAWAVVPVRFNLDRG